MNRKMLAALFLVAVEPVFATTSARLEAIPSATSPIAIDGTLGSSEWQGALELETLAQIRPAEGQPPTYVTRFRLLRDAQNLYVGVFAEDLDSKKISAHQLIQGQLFQSDDRVWVMLDPVGTGRQGYMFQVNANGVRRDALLDNLETFIDDWDAVWEADARITEGGWYVEIAIPWRSLPFNSMADEFGINFGRMLVRKGEYLLWSSVSGQDKPAYWGRVPAPKDIDAGRGLDVVTSAVVRKRDVPREDFELEPSVDLRYRLAAEWQATLTLNTDFSDADLDDREVNLTRFPLFLPEQRYFFVQDSDLFNFGNLSEHGRPFFSRRIALSPTGDPLDMPGGLKVAGRGEHLSLGALAVTQDLPTGGRTELGAMRPVWQVAETFSVGGIATVGNPETGERDLVYGIDARLNARDFLGRFVANVIGYAQRFSAERDTEDDAYGAKITVDGVNSALHLNWDRYGENFDLPLGFLSFRGGQEFSFEHEIAFNVLTSRWRTLMLCSGGSRLEDLKGNLIASVFDVQPINVTTAGGDLFTATAFTYRDVLVEPFNYVGQHEVGVGDYSYERYSIRYVSAEHRPFSTTLGFKWGGFFDGSRRDTTVEFDWKPNPHFALSTSYIFNDAEFRDDSVQIHTGRLRTDIAIDRRWSISTAVQYDDASRELASLLRVRYLPKAGQEYAIVWRDDRFNESGDHWIRDRSEATGLLTYTLRF